MAVGRRGEPELVGFGIRAMSRNLEPGAEAASYHILCYDYEVDGKHVRELQYEACTSMGRMFSSSFCLSVYGAEVIQRSRNEDGRSYHVDLVIRAG
jgi:hypothetical protein